MGNAASILRFPLLKSADDRDIFFSTEISSFNRNHAKSAIRPIPDPRAMGYTTEISPHSYARARRPKYRAWITPVAIIYGTAASGMTAPPF